MKSSVKKPQCFADDIFDDDVTSPIHLFSKLRKTRRRGDSEVYFKRGLDTMSQDDVLVYSDSYLYRFVNKANLYSRKRRKGMCTFNLLSFGSCLCS